LRIEEESDFPDGGIFVRLRPTAGYVIDTEVQITLNRSCSLSDYGCVAQCGENSPPEHRSPEEKVRAKGRRCSRSAAPGGKFAADWLLTLALNMV
jgi:hypothetical protein